jgi:hypothetical protein
MITRERYVEARTALAELGRERAQILPQGLEALRAWLGAGAAARWLAHEGVIQQARAEDLAQAMWWEYTWHVERRRARKAEQKIQRTAATEARNAARAARKQTAPAGAALPAPRSDQGTLSAKAPAVQRSFAPRGEVWRP